MPQNIVPTRLPTNEPGVIRFGWPKAPGERAREAIAGIVFLDAMLVIPAFLDPQRQDAFVML